MGEVGTLPNVSGAGLTNSSNGNAFTKNNTNTNVESNNQQNANNTINVNNDDYSVEVNVENSQTDQKDKNANSAQKTNEGIQLKDMSEEDVKKMVDDLNKELEKVNTNLRFNYHQEAGMFSVAVVDRETNEVIKELPPEEMVKNFVKGKIWMDAFIGTLVDESA